MKFILYFHFYILGSNINNVTTYVRYEKDSIDFYIMDVGYMKFKVDEILDYHVNYDKHSRYLSQKYAVSAAFMCHYKDIKVAIKLNNNFALIFIYIDNSVREINLFKKRPNFYSE